MLGCADPPKTKDVGLGSNWAGQSGPMGLPTSGKEQSQLS